MRATTRQTETITETIKFFGRVEGCTSFCGACALVVGVDQHAHRALLTEDAPVDEDPRGDRRAGAIAVCHGGERLTCELTGPVQLRRSGVRTSDVANNRLDLVDHALHPRL